MASTLSSLQSKLTRYLGAAYIYTSDQQTAALNYARKYLLLNYYIDDFVVQTTLTFTSGKATVPTDYLRKVKMFDANDVIFTRKNVNDFDLDITNTWTIKDDAGTRKIWVYPTATTTLYLRYVKIPTDMVATSDTSGFNPFWDDAHCAVAAWWLLFNDRQPAAAEKLMVAQELIQTALRNAGEEEEELKLISTAYDDDNLFDE